MQQRLNELVLSALDAQRESVDLLAASINATFYTVTDVIAQAPTVITSGLGKSGFIARKLAATLNSINVPSVFVHPVEAAHGDSGILRAGDVVILFSKSGETPEVVRFAAQAQGMGCTTVSITTRVQCRLAEQADHSLFAPIERELDAHNILPTASTTNALILADLLVVAVSARTGSTAEGLRRTHPHGLIGAALQGVVADVMHSGEKLPYVDQGTNISEAVNILTAKGLGCVCVCDARGELLGLITDGDIRRAVQQQRIAPETIVDEIMTPSPVTIASNASLNDALLLMEQRDRQLGVLAVVDGSTCVGVVRLHDIVRRTI